MVHSLHFVCICRSSWMVSSRNRSSVRLEMTSHGSFRDCSIKRFWFWHSRLRISRAVCRVNSTSSRYATLVLHSGSPLGLQLEPALTKPAHIVSSFWNMIVASCLEFVVFVAFLQRRNLLLVDSHIVLVDPRLICSLMFSMVAASSMFLANLF